MSASPWPSLHALVQFSEKVLHAEADSLDSAAVVCTNRAGAAEDEREQLFWDDFAAFLEHQATYRRDF